MRRYLALVLALVSFSACGGADEDTPVTVYAAASLRDVFPAIDKTPRYNFAGSNQLQTQIERGAPADVFASASAKEPEALYAAGRCSRPVAFASNAVVLIVPAGNPGKVTSLESLMSGPRRRLAVGTQDVPVGKYTRELLETAGAERDPHAQHRLQRGERLQPHRRRSRSGPRTPGSPTTPTRAPPATASR